MILPVQKFSTFKNIVRKNSQKLCTRTTHVVPYVAVPLVAYAKKNKDFAVENLIQAMKDNDIEIPTGLKPDPTDQAGFDFSSKGKIKRAIQKACEEGIIDKNTEQDLMHKVSFTGRGDSITETSGLSIHDLAKDRSLLENMSASEISEIDVSMTPELENFTSIHLGENSGEFIDNITDVVMDDLDSDSGIFEMLKKSFLDITEWLGG